MPKDTGKPLSNKTTPEDLEWMLEIVDATDAPKWQKTLLLKLLNFGKRDQ